MADVRVPGPAIQRRFVGLDGTGIVPQLETGIAQVVEGVRQDLGAAHPTEGASRGSIVAGPVQGHAAAIGVTELAGRQGIFPLAEGPGRLLLAVAEPAGRGRSRHGQQAAEQTEPQPGTHAVSRPRSKGASNSNARPTSQ